MLIILCLSHYAFCIIYFKIQIFVDKITYKYTNFRVHLQNIIFIFYFSFSQNKYYPLYINTLSVFNAVRFKNSPITAQSHTNIKI